LGKVEKAVSKGTLAVVNMCNNAEITDIFHSFNIQYNNV